jgi:hypothetical protein
MKWKLPKVVSGSVEADARGIGLASASYTTVFGVHVDKHGDVDRQRFVGIGSATTRRTRRIRPTACSTRGPCATVTCGPLRRGGLRRPRGSWRDEPYT